MCEAYGSGRPAAAAQTGPEQRQAGQILEQRRVPPVSGHLL
jgi:hypothetical protein